MRASQLTWSRCLPLLAVVFTVVLLAGCGRVDLEDLTPEAVKTQQALDAENEPTPTEDTGEAEGTADPNQTETGGGAPQGDVAGGASIYNSQCSGCHEGGRAASLKGKIFDPAVELPKLRADGGFGVPHPVYKLTDIRPLNDEDFNDIFAYLATQ